MTKTQCQNCGASLAADQSGELCPRCLLREALGRGPEADGAGADADLFPRPFGDYELLGELGRGGMGMVFRARQIDLDRIVALKTPVAGAFVDAAARRRFRVEAEAAAHLQHPNIVAIHEVGEIDGQPFFTMDLVDGPDLATLCGGRPLSPRLAAEYLRDIAAAVAAAHAAGVLHRDLKPSNVLVGSDGRPRVTDFGLAKRADLDPGGTATLTGQIIGSPSYAPPEQASGRQRILGPTCDIYGLGALLYHLVTGRAPFVGATATDTLRLVLETEPVAPRLLNPLLPRDLETIGLKCLAKEPARRYASAAEVAEDLERFLANRPIRARPPSVLYRTRKFVQRHRTIVAATALIVLALVCGLVLSLAGYRRVVTEQRATESARHQAEELVGLMTQDLKPALERRGGLSQLLQMTEAAVRYYELLPADLRNTTTERRHADALAALARLRGISLDDRPGAEASMRAALVLREKVAQEDPEDPEAAAAWLWDEWELPWVVGDTAAQSSATRQEEFVHRWHALHARFPRNLRVQQGLAEVLAQYAQGAAAAFDKPKEAVAAATECRTLVGELVAARPGDKTLSDLVEKSLRALATAAQADGDFAQALAVSEQALTYCTDALKADPGNLKLREQAAEAARNLCYRLFAARPERGREAEHIAREHYQVLVELNPDNQEYRFRYALSHMMECYYLFHFDSDLAATRTAFREFHALLEPFIGRKGYESCLQNWTLDCLYLAIVAAWAGEPDEGRHEIERAQLRFADWQGRLPERSFDRCIARVRFLSMEQWSLCALGDWTELARVGRDCLAEIETGLEQQPANGELLLCRALARSSLGIAAERDGRYDEAITLLQPAITIMRAPSGVNSVYELRPMKGFAELALSEAWAQHGDIELARQTVDRLLLGLNFGLVASWPEQEWKARVLTRAAVLCDPAEMPRRLALVERAENILSSPEAKGRLTIGGKEDLAMIAQLRTAIAPRLGVDDLERAGRDLDEAAANDPNIIERITRAGEAAWNFGPWISAISSPQARAAELAIREGHRILSAKYPENQGYRFLFAETHRMECYVHFGLDWQVEPARAAFQKYDALLEPFVGRRGYDSVLRTRVFNSLHLAQLAASVGDRTAANDALAAAGRRFAVYCDHLPGGSWARRLAQVRFLEESAWSAWWLHDWPELARLAESARVESEAALKEQPADEELLLRQAMAGGFAALADWGAARSPEALAKLQLAGPRLGGTPQVVAVWDSPAVVWTMWVAAGEAMQETGDAAGARRALEGAVGFIEAWAPKYPENWRSQRWMAALEVLLAGLLDPAIPAEAVRRKELLDRAAAILAPDKVAGRLTVDVQEVLGKITTLQSAGAL